MTIQEVQTNLPKEAGSDWSAWEGDFTTHHEDRCRRIIGEALVHIKARWPYWSRGLRVLRFVPVPGLTSMAVSEQGVIVYEPSRLLDDGPGCTWTVREVAAVIVHEFHHVISSHGKRARRAGVDATTARTWNLAADYEINNLLHEASAGLPDGACYPWQRDLPTGKLAEFYYHELLEAQQADPGPGTDDPDEGEGEQDADTDTGDADDTGEDGEKSPAGEASADSGEGDPDDAGEGAGTGGGEEKSSDSQDSDSGSGMGTEAVPGTEGASCGSGADGQPMDPRIEQAIQEALGNEAIENQEIEVEKAKRDTVKSVKDRVDIIAKERDRCWQRGSRYAGDDVPNNIKRWADDMHKQFEEASMHSPLQWHQEVARLATTAAPVLRRGSRDYTMARVSRRQGSLGHIDAPRLAAGIDAQPKVVLAVDTSGSVTCAMVTGILAEISKLHRNLNLDRIRVISCDTQVRGDVTVGNPNAARDSVSGGGGTRFDPVFERIAEGPKPDILIYFTDGYGTVHTTRDPGYPVIWCLWGRRCSMPSFSHKESFGKEIIVDLLEHI